MRADTNFKRQLHRSCGFRVQTVRTGCPQGKHCRVPPHSFEPVFCGDRVLYLVFHRNAYSHREGREFSPANFPMSEFLLLKVPRRREGLLGTGTSGKRGTRVKPQNRRQPGRPRLPWTAARTTKCYGNVRPALRSDHRTTQLLSQLLCRTESQRQCP